MYKRQPYGWILDSQLDPISFSDFNSVLLTILGVCANGSIALIALILVLILAWNYIKLLFEAAERYVLLGVLIYTAPMAVSYTHLDVYKRQVHTAMCPQNIWAPPY